MNAKNELSAGVDAQSLRRLDSPTCARLDSLACVRPWLLAGAVALGLATAHVRPAAAMTVLIVDLKTLVTESALVLHGGIEKVTPVDRRKEGRGIWTEFTLRVADVWKGDTRLKSTAFAWRHVGGTAADGMTVAVPGMPGFAVGEEVVVVLEKTSESWVVSGGPQGKFGVAKDKLGRRVVTREIHDVAGLQRDAATGRLREAPTPVAVSKFLEDFRSEVLGYVADAAKGVRTLAPNPTGTPALAGTSAPPGTRVAPAGVTGQAPLTRPPGTRAAGQK
ncbi:MAG: hypothetical protein EXR79_11990 [Myxococcales bacterium]|nr:hypothetical protein [Myxococcales bacterium]